MKTLTPEKLVKRLEGLAPHPRVVAAGNFATPHRLLELVDGNVETFTLHMLNAQGEIPDRPGVTHETTFVGPAMRKSPALMYYPCRLSLTPVILRYQLPVDVLLLREHDEAKATGRPRFVFVRGARGVGKSYLTSLLTAAVSKRRWRSRT